MRPEKRAYAADDLEVEREVDFGRVWETIVSRWWIVLAAIAAGIAIGYVVSLGSGNLYQAKATVYLGQPLTPVGSGSIQGIQTNPSAVGQIARSASVVRQVATEVGVPQTRLREGISTKAVSGAVARLGQTSFYEIIVRGPWRQKSGDAANRLAQVVVDQVSRYPKRKGEELELLAKSQEEELAALDARIERYTQTLESGASTQASNLDVLIGLAEQRRGQLVEEETQTRLALTVVEEVESGQILTEASATKVAARSRRASMIVGAVIGLLVGIALALVWTPLLERVRRTRAT